MIENFNFPFRCSCHWWAWCSHVPRELPNAVFNHRCRKSTTRHAWRESLRANDVLEEGFFMIGAPSSTFQPLTLEERRGDV